VVLPLFLASLALCQDAKPNFAGMWKVTGGTHPPKAGTSYRIVQGDTTFAITTIRPGASTRILYPTNGQARRSALGTMLRIRNGHWEGASLVLESTVWMHRQKHLTREVVTLSPDKRVMTMSFHAFRSDHQDDYDVVSERVGK
jgi:hypothetical protein